MRMPLGKMGMSFAVARRRVLCVASDASLAAVICTPLRLECRPLDRHGEAQRPHHIVQDMIVAVS
jgi:hypothetical protein